MQIVRLMGQFSQTFSAGAIAAFFVSLLVCLLGELDIMATYGVNLHPVLTKNWLYSQMIHGGLWGFIYACSFLQKAYVTRGILLSLVPALIHFLIIFPIIENQGIFGSRLGEWTPAFVVGFYIIWGVLTSLWMKWTQRGG